MRNHKDPWGSCLVDTQGWAQKGLLGWAQDAAEKARNVAISKKSRERAAIATVVALIFSLERRDRDADKLPPLYL